MYEKASGKKPKQSKSVSTSLKVKFSEVLENIGWDFGKVLRQPKGPNT